MGIGEPLAKSGEWPVSLVEHLCQVALLPLYGI